jgi:hypothetical protein
MHDTEGTHRLANNLLELVRCGILPGTVSCQLERTFLGVFWLQWNGNYRDGMRSFVKSDHGMVTQLMTRIYGSSNLFPDDVMNAYHPCLLFLFPTAANIASRPAIERERPHVLT